MTLQEACERIEMLMAQPYHHNLQWVKAILEDLEKDAYQQGKEAGYQLGCSTPELSQGKRPFIEETYA